MVLLLPVCLRRKFCLVIRWVLIALAHNGHTGPGQHAGTEKRRENRPRRTLLLIGVSY